MIPSNLPSSEPRRLLRRNTGRATPLADRIIMTAEERNRLRERQQARENSLENSYLSQQQQQKSSNDPNANQSNSSILPKSILDISDPYIGDKKVVAASLVDNSFGSNYNVLKRTIPGARVHSVNVVSAQDPRAEWLDSSHRSERRNDHSIHKAAAVTKNDIKYNPEQDTYQPRDESVARSVGRSHYTDAERLALANLQKSKELMTGGSSSSNSFDASVSRQRTSSPAARPFTNRRASSSSNQNDEQQNQNSTKKSFAQIYHDRLNHLEINNNDSNLFQQKNSTLQQNQNRNRNNNNNSVSTRSASALGFHDLQRTSGNMQQQIADATRNFFGGRHAPAAHQASIQGPRDSAARLLHGDHTNRAGHHDLFDPVKFQNQETDDRRKTRAIHWKQERVDREEFNRDRREAVYARQGAIEKTKHERSCSRVKDLERDVDYFLRREKGPKLVKECPVRSENSRIGNWLFDYPVKKN